MSYIIKTAIVRHIDGGGYTEFSVLKKEYDNQFESMMTLVLATRSRAEAEAYVTTMTSRPVLI